MLTAHKLGLFFFLLCVLPETALAETTACLITKNNTNPFFVKMKEGAEKGAAEQGIELKSFAGEKDGDASPQITAIENCVAAGVKGILITPSNDDVGPALKAARAAGALVISLDTPLGDAEAQDMTFATDKFEAGVLIGKWTKATMGDKAASAKVAILNYDSGFPSFDFLRTKGFLTGFGIDGFGVNQVPATACGCSCKEDACKRSCRECLGTGSDNAIIGIAATGGKRTGGYDLGGKAAMEKVLQESQSTPDVVYVADGLAAAGAYEALKSAGKESDVTIVSMGGDCEVVKEVAAGAIGATSQEYPLLMALRGIEAIVAFARDGTKPAPSEGKSFFDVGTSLVTDRPVSSVNSLDTETAIEKCWG